MMLIQKLSRHLALPFGIAALLLFGITALFNHAHQNAGTLYLKDRIGDRSAINPIKISGDISDRYAGTSFEIKNGQLTKHTAVYDPPVLMSDRYIYSYGGKKRIDGLDYEVKGDYTYYVNYQDPLHHEIQGKSSPIHTGVTNPEVLESGLARIGHHLYFTVPTTKDSTGMNGIYEPSLEEDGETRTIAEFSMDEQREDDTFVILGLESAGDKLVLVLRENGHLVVRGYDPNSGQILGNIVLDQSDIEYAGRYEAFNNDQTLNLVFLDTTTSDYDVRFHKTVWSIEFHDGIRLIDQTNLDYENNWHDYLRSRMNMLYRNGQLYVVYTSTEPRTEGRMLDGFLPIHLLIRVYKSNQLNYEGELVSDLNDDSIITQNLAEGQLFGSNEDYRLLDHLQLQPRKED